MTYLTKLKRIIGTRAPILFTVYFTMSTTSITLTKYDKWTALSSPRNFTAGFASLLNKAALALNIFLLVWNTTVAMITAFICR